MSPVPFVHDHGLYELRCQPGKELEFFGDLRLHRYGRQDEERRRSGEDESASDLPDDQGGIPPDQRPGWHFISDRTAVLANPDLPRVCLTIEGGIGKTTALRQARHLWLQQRGRLAILIEAKDLPTDVDHFLKKPCRGKELPLLLEKFRDELDRATPATQRSGSHTATGGEQADEARLRRTVERAVRSGQLLLLVDAFDQASFADDREARSRVQQLTLFLRRHPNVRCVISGRPYAIQHLGGLGTNQGDSLLGAHADPPWRFYQVPEFTEPQVRFFLDHGEQQSRFEALQTVEADLLTVPRFLERLRTVSFEDLGRLRTASDVYWESLQSLISTGLEDQAQAQGRDWTLERVVRLLALLAWEMFRQGYSVEVPNNKREPFLKRIVLARGQEWLEAQALPGTFDSLLNEVEAFGKLNIMMDQAVLTRRDPGAIRWSDQTLQDFFAAVWLTRHAGPRIGVGDLGLDDAMWMTQSPRLHVRAVEETALWHPVWRFATEMPCVGGLFQETQAVVCDPHCYLSLISSLLEARVTPRRGQGLISRTLSFVSRLFSGLFRPQPLRSTEMIYRCWPTLLALAGKLQVPADRTWFEREVTDATTGLQAEIWKQLAADLEWQPTAEIAPGSSPVARQAWVVLAQFLAPYPRLALGRGDSREMQIARDFETWFRPIPNDPQESLAFPMSAEGQWGDRFGETYNTKLDSPFQLAQYPTTNAVYHLFDPGHWRRFEDYRQYTDKDRTDRNRPEPQCPVQYTTWYDAWCACTWLHCRLPTEHEWEYACRAAPDQPPQPFWFEDESRATAQYLWCYTTQSEERVDTVGGRPGARRDANAWGLYDMHGNVWEWTASWFFDHAKKGRQDSARARSRVLRGGSFYFYPGICRAAVRIRRHPTHINNDNGFRAARACSPR
jgi:hypothetical protein